MFAYHFWKLITWCSSIQETNSTEL